MWKLLWPIIASNMFASQQSLLVHINFMRVRHLKWNDCRFIFRWCHQRMKVSFFGSVCVYYLTEHWPNLLNADAHKFVVNGSISIQKINYFDKSLGEEAESKSEPCWVVKTTWMMKRGRRRGKNHQISVGSSWWISNVGCEASKRLLIMTKHEWNERKCLLLINWIDLNIVCFPATAVVVVAVVAATILPQSCSNDNALSYIMLFSFKH